MLLFLLFFLLFFENFRGGKGYFGGCPPIAEASGIGPNKLHMVLMNAHLSQCLNFSSSGNSVLAFCKWNSRESLSMFFCGEGLLWEILMTYTNNSGHHTIF